MKIQLSSSFDRVAGLAIPVRVSRPLGIENHPNLVETIVEVVLRQDLALTIGFFGGVDDALRRRSGVFGHHHDSIRFYFAFERFKVKT